MINTTKLSEMLKINKTIGDNADIVVSLAAVAIRELEASSEKEEVTNLYDVITILKVILEKSLDSENNSVELGCYFDNLKSKAN